MKLNRTIEDDTITFFSENQKIFWIKEELNDTVVTIFVGGNLLSETTHEFQDEILALISMGLDIIIDFAEVKYIAASYMKALLKMQISIDQKEKGSIKLTNIPAQIRGDLDKTGITELLWIE